MLSRLDLATTRTFSALAFGIFVAATRAFAFFVAFVAATRTFAVLVTATRAFAFLVAFVAATRTFTTRTFTFLVAFVAATRTFAFTQHVASYQRRHLKRIIDSLAICNTTDRECACEGSANSQGYGLYNFSL